MSFCVSTTDTITDSNYATTMPGASVLPENGFRRSAAGVVEAESVRSWISTLLAREQVVIPTAPSPDIASASAFATKAQALRNNIDAEYCYYYRRYTFALTKLLNQAVAADAATLAANSSYQTLKQNTIKLNNKLNDIIELLNGMTSNTTTKLQSYYNTGGLNKLNDDLGKTKEQLMASSKLLQSADLEVEAKKAMIDYTLEKNSASRNMLGVYVFMNLVAGGLLFYLYRNTSA